MEKDDTQEPNTETDIKGNPSYYKIDHRLAVLIWEVLLEEGYDPIVSWFVCYYELKTIVDLFHDKGFDYLFDSISDTAKYGGLNKGKFLMDDDFELKLKKMITDIKSGDFNKELSNVKNFTKNQSSFKDIEHYTKKILEILKNKDS